MAAFEEQNRVIQEVLQAAKEGDKKDGSDRNLEGDEKPVAETSRDGDDNGVPEDVNSWKIGKSKATDEGEKAPPKKERKKEKNPVYENNRVTRTTEMRSHMVKPVPTGSR